MNTAGDDMAEYFRLFVEETGEQLDSLVEIMLRLEAAPDDRNHLAEAFRMIHSIKGSSALLGLEQITSLSHMLESHFDRLRSGKQRLDAEGMDCTLACIDFLRICNDDIRDGRPLKNDPELLARVDRLEHTRSAAAAAPADRPGVGPLRAIVRLQPELPMVEMKVELLLTRLSATGTVLSCEPAREQAAQLPSIRELAITFAEGTAAEAIREAADIDGVEEVLINVVQNVGSGAGDTVSDAVRDIANELGKRVSLELCGEKTELDKRMIDEIGDPLNHLIRNSIDHGIESAAARTAAGKPAVATVRLTASHRGNNVFITVEDDGGGIDGERVRQTAVKRGLLSQATAETLAESELHELIWQPGFSTASKISDISGRGVGMDSVRTKIIGLNGSIDVDSRRGEGTCFTIRLPLTLTIARCMLFRVDEGVFGVPIENVREIVSAQGLRSVATGGRTLADIRGEMLPLVSIHDLFHWSGSVRSREADAVIVLQSGHRLLGLRAETLLGGQDVVIKPLDENFLHVRGLGGASVLGDGSVCLLLDTASCIDLAQQDQKTRSDAAARFPQVSS